MTTLRDAERQLSMLLTPAAAYQVQFSFYHGPDGGAVRWSFHHVESGWGCENANLDGLLADVRAWVAGPGYAVYLDRIKAKYEEARAEQARALARADEAILGAAPPAPGAGGPGDAHG